MYPIKLSYTPSDDNSTGYANTVVGTSGLPFVLATTTPGDGLAHLVSIAPSGAVTGNYTLTGTDADGLAQTEVLATDGANTVTSVNYYLTLTEVIAPSGIGAETVNIGWTDDIVGPTFSLNWRQSQFQVSLGVDVSGTISYTVQHTFTQLSSGNPSTFKWWPHATLVAKTVDADGNYAFPCTAARLLINSLTAGATITWYIVQGK